MFIESLYLRNFRNYAEVELSFSPKFNVFYGENGQGKTNLLEALYLIATGRSFRAEQLQELIRQGETFFFIEAKILKEGIRHTVQISFDGATKKLILDNNHYTTLQHLIGMLPSVLYTPSDGNLIDGSPADRRRLLNLHLAQSDPLYMHHLSRFWRAMKQRNVLLKTKQLIGIEAWEEEMAFSAVYLLQKRIEFIEEIAPALSQMGTRLSGKEEKHDIRFHPSHPTTAEGYLAQLKKNRLKEQILGATLTGPHRDDFTLQIEGKAARTYASEGQKKTAIAALRLAEWERLTKMAGSPAILGIDDLGLHLDEKRHPALRTTLQALGQVFITTPSSSIDWKELAEGKKFSVAEGVIQNVQVSLT